MTTSEQARCAQCTREFMRPKGRGRPARYCGSVCRRASEYELARAQSLLRRAEQKLQDAGLLVATAERHRQAEAARSVEFWTAEVARLQAELRRLLEASEAAPQFPRSA